MKLALRMVMTLTAVSSVWEISVQTTAPSPSPESQGDQHKEIVAWLSRFGYLPPQDQVSGQSRTWEAVSSAIQSMQEFAGIRVTGILDEATWNLTRIPRCSIPDREAAAPGRFRRNTVSVWTKRNLSWRIQSYPRDSVLPRETIRAVMFYSLKVWAGVIPLRFHEVEGQRADIQIAFHTGEHGDSYPFDGTGHMVAHAFLPGNNVMAGTVHFDGAETWAFRSHVDLGTDLFTVALHEFGHALGLSHSASRHSIMCPYYQGPVGDPLHYRLEAVDQLEVQRLYGPREQLEDGGPEGFSLTPLPPESGGDGPSLRGRGDLPDRCQTSFDASAQIRGETFFFKGRFFWRLSLSGHLTSLRPTRISRFWWGFPSNLEHVDAVYERQSDHKIIFFRGAQYWLFQDNVLQEGYPRPISDFGLSVSGIDAVFSGNFDGKTYFFRNGFMWIYDEREEKLDPNSPSEFRPWAEIPQRIDSALSWKDGAVYFLRAQECWRYEMGGSLLTPEYPCPFADLWLGCEGMGKGQSVREQARPPQAGSVLHDSGEHVENVAVCECGSGGQRLGNRGLVLVLQAAVFLELSDSIATWTVLHT
ncbi:matrix metalloproteinase-17-like isoform X2 [Stegostoma tigrinum]|uniref:matrix metalloproteinase-17-like isoform X2 n=1 Tax=Stegostoma tigrinum TaxID=3053191 RepID=UPI00202B4FC7|nr:matrix metalloproteinase-17-like isoform X2 [Stegostoma tigrinum]